MNGSGYIHRDNNCYEVPQSSKKKPNIAIKIMSRDDSGDGTLSKEYPSNKKRTPNCQYENSGSSNYGDYPFLLQQIPNVDRGE